MPYIRVWIHIVWSTKNRESLLSNQIRPIVFNHIKENASEKNIFLTEVNGYLDHVHCLISLKRNQNISHVVQLLKGESSHWINQQSLISGKFHWQKEYYAVSVGESEIARVRRYIRNQEAHHRKQSFEEEIDILKKKYGLTRIEE